MSPPYLLDTNAVSIFMHGRSSSLDDQVFARSKPELCVSAISYGEILYCLASRPEAVRLAATAAKLFELVDILPWTPETALRYGGLRAAIRRAGKTLQPIDMLIAAHALEAGAVLVSSDRAFLHVPGLTVVDWTAG